MYLINIDCDSYLNRYVCDDESDMICGCECEWSEHLHILDSNNNKMYESRCNSSANKVPPQFKRMGQRRQYCWYRRHKTRRSTQQNLINSVRQTAAYSCYIPCEGTECVRQEPNIIIKYLPLYIQYSVSQLTEFGVDRYYLYRSINFQFLIKKKRKPKSRNYMLFGAPRLQQIL